MEAFTPSFPKSYQIIYLSLPCLGSKGWHSGESTSLPPMWNGIKSRRRHHMWFEFVVGSLLCSKRFFSGYSRFPLSSKTNISKFQFHKESGRRRTTLWMCYLQIHYRDQCGAAPFRYSNRGEITVLIFKQQPNPVMFSCRRKTQPVECEHSINLFTYS